MRRVANACKSLPKDIADTKSWCGYSMGFFFLKAPVTMHKVLGIKFIAWNFHANKVMMEWKFLKQKYYASAIVAKYGATVWTECRLVWQELSFGLIIWGSSPKGKMHLSHISLFRVWHQCTVRDWLTLGEASLERCKPCSSQELWPPWSDNSCCLTARRIQEESQHTIPHDTCQVRGCNCRDS